MLGPGLAGTHYSYIIRDIRSLVRGVVERILLKKLDGEWGQPLRPTLNALLAFRPFESAVCKKVRASLGSPLTMKQFLDRYQGAKKRKYTLAGWRYRKFGLLLKFLKSKLIVKDDKFDFVQQTNPCPRIIVPESEEFNVAFGRFTAALEKPLYKAIDDVFGAPVVMKGKNALQQAADMRDAWLEFDDPIVISGDMSRNDQSSGHEIMECEHRAILRFFRGNRELRGILEARSKLHAFGYATNEWGGGFKIELDLGELMRVTGGMDTALGTVYVLCAKMYNYFQGLPFKCRLFDNGDDFFLMMERAHAQYVQNTLPEFVRRYGYDLTMEEPVDVFERIDFCQTHPVYDGEKYVMCRDPRVVLSKDLLTTKYLRSERYWSAYRAAISDCGMALAGNLPIMGSFYRAIGRGAVARESVKLDCCGFTMLAEGMISTTVQVSDASRYSFYQAFGIAPDDQVAIEEYYDSVVHRWSPPMSNLNIHTKEHNLILPLFDYRPTCRINA